jgi:HK97 family phage portal protein
MSVIGRALFGAERRSYWWPHIAQAMAGTANTTGKAVTPQSAVGSTAVWAAVRIISESIATLPLRVYERRDGGRTLATEHPLYPLLHDRPNVRQTAVEWREQQLASLLLWGNAYSWIERWPSGRPRWLWPLRADRVTVKVDVTTQSDPVPGLVYVVQTIDGGQVVYPADDVLHVRGLSSDGMLGLSPIAIHRDAVGLEMAEREFAARFFGNNGRPGGVLKVQGRLSNDAAQRLKASWETAHRGLDNAHRVAVLEEGIEWQGMGMPLADAQFVEQRRFSIEEVARIFRVPLHLMGDLQRATFSNIEHQSIEFVTHTIRPWCVRLEQAFNGLLYPSERQSLYTEHAVDALLRGDIKARYEAYAVGRSWGWLSVNEIRALENLNGVGPDGDTLVQPLNYGPLGATTPAPQASPTAQLARAIVEEVEPRRLLPEVGDAEVEVRALGVPSWMRRNCRRGLAWYEQGLAGEGIVARTVREARQMASGSVSEDKVRRMAAWFARHMVDLNAPDADPESDGYPSPGVVAHALWGGGTRAQSERAMRWAKARVAEMDGADAPAEGRASLPDSHEGDVMALGAMAIRALDVPGIAQAIRESLGAER